MKNLKLRLLGIIMTSVMIIGASSASVVAYTTKNLPGSVNGGKMSVVFSGIDGEGIEGTQNPNNTPLVLREGFEYSLTAQLEGTGYAVFYISNPGIYLNSLDYQDKYMGTMPRLYKPWIWKDAHSDNGTIKFTPKAGGKDLELSVRVSGKRNVIDTFTDEYSSASNTIIYTTAHSVEFNVNGKAVHENIVEWGKKITEPDLNNLNININGQISEGWYDELGNRFDFNTPIEKNTKLWLKLKSADQGNTPDTGNEPDDQTPGTDNTNTPDTDIQQPKPQDPVTTDSDKPGNDVQNPDGTDSGNSDPINPQPIDPSIAQIDPGQPINSDPIDPKTPERTTPFVTIDPLPTDPAVTINDETTPLSGGSEMDVDPDTSIFDTSDNDTKADAAIEDDSTPLVADVKLNDDNVPLSDIPKTGQLISVGMISIAVLILSSAGFLITFFFRKKEDYKKL